MTNNNKPSRQEMIDEIYDKIAERNIKKINDQIAKITCKPVMIGDVMDWFGEKTIDMCWSDSACAIDIREGKNSLDLFHFWKNKRKPIEEQSDECIEFIYDLISE